MRSPILVVAVLALCSGTSWSQCEVRHEQTLNSVATPAVELGESVTVYGEWSFAGSPFDSSIAPNAGRVYAFAPSGDPQWIGASDAGAGDQFGIAIAAGAGRLIVGSHGDDDTVQNAGAVYVFELQAGLFVEVQKLLPQSPHATNGSALRSTFTEIGWSSVRGGTPPPEPWPAPRRCFATMGRVSSSSKSCSTPAPRPRSCSGGVWRSGSSASRWEVPTRSSGVCRQARWSPSSTTGRAGFRSSSWTVSRTAPSSAAPSTSPVTC